MAGLEIFLSRLLFCYLSYMKKNLLLCLVLLALAALSVDPAEFRS